MRYVLKAGSVHPSRGPEGVKYTLWEPWPSVTSLPPPCPSWSQAPLLDVLCAQLTRDLFAIAQLLLKVLGYYKRVCGRFPDSHFRGQTILGQDDSRTYVSQTRRFPNRRFPDNTFFRHHYCADALHKRGLCRRIVSVRPPLVGAIVAPFFL